MSMLLLLLKNGQWDVCTGRRCSAKETVFGSLPNFCCPGRKFGLNRISHPDWVKLCVKLNCAPNQNAKLSSATSSSHLLFVFIFLIGEFYSIYIYIYCYIFIMNFLNCPTLPHDYVNMGLD